MSSRSSSATTYFNPRSPYGERPVRQRSRSGSTHFNPRSPYGERPAPVDYFSNYEIFQSTLPIRGATYMTPTTLWTTVISIHAPHTGSDLGFRFIAVYTSLFQSTLPIRGATERSTADVPQMPISIHAPHTGSDHAFRIVQHVFTISIHAPHTGSDRFLLHISVALFRFQSTLPIRGATPVCALRSIS